MPVLLRPSRDDAQQKPDQSQRSLHGEAALIGGFPLREERTVIEIEAGRLLRYVDVNSGAGKSSGDNERELCGQQIFRPDVGDVKPTTCLSFRPTKRTWKAQQDCGYRG